MKSEPLSSRHFLLSMALMVVVMVAVPMAKGESNADLVLAKEGKLTSESNDVLGTHFGDFALRVGDLLPNFTVNNHMGESVDSGDLLERGPLLVIFYRGGWCPYCNRQIHQLSKAYHRFEKVNLLPVLISADSPDAASLANRTYDIPFPVLSDPELIAHDAFKVTMELPEEMVERYRDFGIVLEDWNQAGHRKFAVSSAFILSKQGKVLWSHSSADYKKRPTIDQFLQVFSSLQ